MSPWVGKRRAKKLEPCTCGALAAVAPGVGMYGQPGWRVTATCGTTAFGNSRGGIVASWNTILRNHAAPETPPTSPGETP